MWTVVDSPVGQLRIVARDGAVNAIEFEPFRPPADGRPLGERVEVSAGSPTEDAPTERALAETVRQLADYFAGDLTTFDLPLAPYGTGFQQRVWRELQGIGYGKTTTYGEIAGRLGQTNAASRAVGLANGRNPIPIVIPCHRVIGADGSLTGYAGGMQRKQTLLDLEQGALF